MLVVESLLAPGGSISRRLEGYEVRPQQAEMAAAVQRAMEERGRLLVEAGTGVGKSFAYLIPAIKRIIEHRERVVVATHTINLQEQLIEKDVPLLRAVIPDEFSAVLVKGRNNYLSRRRLRLAASRQDQLFGDEEMRHSLHLIEQWASTTQDGTQSTLPVLPRPEVWDYAQSDTHNCMGKRCPTYESCFYQAARRRMHNGDLLICNHALFFADLALRARGVAFLPPYQHVVLDEAHAVEDVAAEHFGASLTEGRVAHLLNLLHQPRTERGFLATVRLQGRSSALRDEAIDAARRCRHAADALFESLWAWFRGGAPPNGRIGAPDVVADSLGPPMKELAGALKLARERAESEPDRYELNSYAERATDIAADAAVLLGQRLPECVYWLDGTTGRVRGGTGRPRLGIRCMPIEVGPALQERLFGQEISVVLTSATLATGAGDFSHVKERLGCPGAAALQLGSPFDFASQMRVFVDHSMPPPSAPDYVDQLVPRIRQQVRETGGGAFVLFTSFDMLNRAAAALRPLFADDGYPVLVQDQDGPRTVLLRRFRDDEKSVLLGTASFWQGVDVRGRGLRNVIITRLPFDVPDLPLLQARHERIRERGGDPFRQDQIPKAVIRFKQGIGRLIRSATDTGRVVVLDPRIVTKSYGRNFLEAIPPGVEVRLVAGPDQEPETDSLIVD